MNKEYKKYFNFFLEDIIKKYKCTKNLEEGISDKELEMIRNRYIKYLDEMSAWEEIKEYYDKYVYIDKYGIFDWFIEKDMISYIGRLYLGDHLSLQKFIGYNYSIINRDKILEEEKLKETLEYLHLHVKRGNLKVRVFLSINYKYNEYLKENADEFIEEIKEQYLKAGTWEGGPQDKNDFMEFWVEITLVENKWLDYKDLVKN